MFEIGRDGSGRVRMSGRFNASHAERARDVLSSVSETCTVDFTELEYISSAGLSVLLETQQRLGGTGHELVLTGLSRHLTDLFRIAGFDRIFKIR